MNKNDKILVLGSTGLVGGAILEELKTQGYSNILSPIRSELDLLNQKSTLSYFEKFRPDHVIVAAAKVGGIYANNTYRADFIFENLSVQNNVFEASFKNEVDKLLFLGSSCIYPKGCPQPMKEEYLLSSPLEPTNEPYAIAKIAGLKLAESFRRQYGKNYISVMPTNLYGKNDNFHEENSHVIPGLIARMTKSIKNDEPIFKVWGTGQPRREFLYVDDLAKACIYILNQDIQSLPYLLNIGAGEDIKIEDLAYMIADIMNFKGEILFDTKYPDGTPQKLLDISKIKELGWSPSISLRDGLVEVIGHFKKMQSEVRSF